MQSKQVEIDGVPLEWKYFIPGQGYVSILEEKEEGSVAAQLKVVCSNELLGSVIRREGDACWESRVMLPKEYQRAMSPNEHLALEEATEAIERKLAESGYLTGRKPR